MFLLTLKKWMELHYRPRPTPRLPFRAPRIPAALPDPPPELLR
jgi:hypothetical protein